VKEFRKIYTQDDELNRVQDSAKATFDSFSREPLINKIELSGTIATGGTTLQHALGKVPAGFLIVDKDANADVWRTDWTKTSITLKASAAVGVKLFLF